jgi:hypothetical protein
MKDSYLYNLVLFTERLQKQPKNITCTFPESNVCRSVACNCTPKHGMKAYCASCPFNKNLTHHIYNELLDYLSDTHAK